MLLVFGIGLLLIGVLLVCLAAVLDGLSTFSSDKPMIPAIFGAISIIAGIIMLIASIGFYFDRRACSQMGQEYDVESRYHKLSGCYLKLKDGRFISEKRFFSIVEFEK